LGQGFFPIWNCFLSERGRGGKGREGGKRGGGGAKATHARFCLHPTLLDVAYRDGPAALFAKWQKERKGRRERGGERKASAVRLPSVFSIVRQMFASRPLGTQKRGKVGGERKGKRGKKGPVVLPQHQPIHSRAVFGREKKGGEGKRGKKRCNLTMSHCTMNFRPVPGRRKFPENRRGEKEKKKKRGGKGEKKLPM